MNRKFIVVLIITLVCVGLVSTAAAQSDKPDAPEAAVGTAFTYQGQLKKGGSLHTGPCNFQFSLWDALSGGAQKGSTQTATNVQVTSGLFIVPLNFGDQFQGDARWLQIAVRCPAGIKFTDVMYELKRLGIDYGMYSKDARAPVLSREFVKIVDRNGRNDEVSLLSNFYLKTNPLGLVRMAPLGLKLFSRGRLAFRPSKIKGHDDLAKIMKKLASKEGK